ncbi:MAG: Aminomethyltransferase [Alphaproteobacteria bacterium MarineAlpha3_Bin5]|nr:glycine cleavage system protein T [Magnetovibrio sp.]PPR76560.1 MAG: Aminomethyltransferase [Alphaproteobacteria bacterium MarineAlpha3_Bin5]
MGSIEENARIERLYLEKFHQERGAKIVPFAGYAMPVHYSSGIIAEHLHTRKAAALFDITHMGQALLKGLDPAKALESLAPSNFVELAPWQMCYTVLTNNKGGILDDFMVTNFGRSLFLIVNGALKKADFSYIKRNVNADVELETLDERAFFALQGPLSEQVLSRVFPEVKEIFFLSSLELVFRDAICFVSRSGYSGEDGFEISVPFDVAHEFAEIVEAQPEVIMAGLGARDSLRLEAGLCLYGNDINQETTPIEAGLQWVVGKERVKTGGFPGANVIIDQVRQGPSRQRVGIRICGRAIARQNTEIESETGQKIGFVTSGGFCPSMKSPLAMGYVQSRFAGDNTRVRLLVRGKKIPGIIQPLPFIKHRYVRSSEKI